MAFKSLIQVGFDKNGEADFRVSMDIADLSREKMNEFRQMLPQAIARAEQAWVEKYQRQFKAMQNDKFPTPEKYQPVTIEPIKGDKK